jgi:hypothetical protein
MVQKQQVSGLIFGTYNHRFRDILRALPVHPSRQGLLYFWYDYIILYTISASTWSGVDAVEPFISLFH